MFFVPLVRLFCGFLLPPHTATTALQTGRLGVFGCPCHFAMNVHNSNLLIRRCLDVLPLHTARQQLAVDYTQRCGALRCAALGLAPLGSAPLGSAWLDVEVTCALGHLMHRPSTIGLMWLDCYSTLSFAATFNVDSLCISRPLSD